MEHSSASSANTPQETALAEQLKQLELNEKKLKRRIRRLEHDRESLSAMYENAVRLRDFNARERERQYFYNRLLLEACPSFLIIFDINLFFVVGTGGQSAPLLGFHDAMVLNGLSLQDLFASIYNKSWIDWVEAQCREALSTRKPIEHSQTLLTVEGETRYMSLMITPAMDDRGVLQGLVLMMHDVSELARARAEAEAASRAKNNFLANMSHEIRTPMNAILGMASLLNLTELNDQQRGYVKNVLAASNSLMNLISDVLDFSTIDAKQFTLSDQPYSISELLGDVANAIGLRAFEKNLVFLTDIDPNLPATFAGDDLRIKQILINLLSNAVQYTEKGVVRLSADAVNAQSDGQVLLRFIIADTGIGIAPEAIPDLFSAFADKDLWKHQKIQGTGLGLALVKSLVTAMGGTVDVESQIGQGSVFTVTLAQKVLSKEPLASLMDPGKKRVLLLGAGPATAALARTFQRLFIACDIASDRQAFQVLLSKHTYTHVFYWYDQGQDAVLPETKRLGDTVVVAIKRLSSIASQNTRDNVRVLFEPILIHEVAKLLNSAGRETAENASHSVLGTFETQGVRVLVVDDNEINLLVAVELLMVYGISVDTAESGMAAIELCKVNVYHIIFMDQMMPEMDGLEATERIRALGGICATVPIVALTANAITGVKDQYLERGMSDYLSKPIEIDELNRVLKRWLPHEALRAHFPAPKNKTTEDGDGIKSSILQEISTTSTLSVRDALAQIGGSEETYLIILRTFSGNIERRVRSLLEYLAAGDWRGYQIEVHSQKSALSNIGEKALSEQARKLELAIFESNTDYVHETTAAYVEKMLALHRTLRDALQEEAPEANKPAATDADRIALRGHFHDLLVLLESLENEATMEKLNQILAFDYGPEINSRLQIIAEAVELFDYDTAILTLEAGPTGSVERNADA